jgi:putative ABC transport system substrate-binding protein
MKRRDFITLVGGAAVAVPLAARAQQSAMPVIGFLHSVSRASSTPLVAAFHQGLKETGFIEGQNVAVEYRWAAGHYDQLPAMAADLVRRQVSVIATTGGSPSALAAKAATTMVPIVFQLGGDPVALGLVTSLSRPVGNLTGVTNLGVELGPKQLELVHALTPTQTIIALLVNPTAPYTVTLLEVLEAAARSLGRDLHVLHASSDRDFDGVFATLASLGAGALVIGTDAFLNSRNEQLGELTLRHGMPAIFQFREFAAAGGLMAYGGSRTDAYRLVGLYTGRVLKGEKPADLPVQQTTKAELIINLKTAKTLGITFPLTLLGRADEVIE